MGKLRCLCGNQISDVLCPSPNTGLLIRDRDMEAADGKDIVGLLEIGRDVWECHECGRIAVMRPDGDCDAPAKWYKPEDGSPGKLFVTELKHDPDSLRSPDHGHLFLRGSVG